MNESTSQTEAPPATPRRHPLVVALAVVLALESFGAVVVAGYLVVELFAATPSSYPSAIALAATVAIAAVWVGFIVAGVLRGKAWTRAAAIVVQILIGAIAIGSLEGLMPRPDIAWTLLVPAIVALGLLFTRPVLAATSRRSG